MDSRCGILAYGHLEVEENHVDLTLYGHRSMDLEKPSKNLSVAALLERRSTRSAPQGPIAIL